MGCCVSTDRGSHGEKEAHLQVGVEFFHQKSSLESRAPPPSAEEETVKEVLSETPKPKVHIFNIPQEEENKQMLIEKPAFVKIQEKESLNFVSKIDQPKSPLIEESASEDVSEICSASLSESVSNITDRRDDNEEEVRQQKVFKSPARSGPRNQVTGRSPTRKLDQSPGRRNGVVNGGSSSSSSSVKMVQYREPIGPPRRGSRPDPPRKDAGESSGRRSRSPAVNRSIMGRSPSGRKSNPSPCRVRSDPAGECGNSKNVQHLQHCTTATNTEGKWPTSNNNGSATPSSTNESLENPLVSLECFIFL